MIYRLPPLLILVACYASAVVAAESVTFGFEAEINEVAGDGQADLPFQISQGDEITGLLKITSDPQQNGVEITIEGVSLTSERLSVSVFNDTSFDDGPFDSQIVDLIRAGCGVAPSADCLPSRQEIGASTPFVFGVEIEFIVLAMGLKPSPSGETFRFLHWRDGKLPHRQPQSL